MAPYENFDTAIFLVRSIFVGNISLIKVGDPFPGSAFGTATPTNNVRTIMDGPRYMLISSDDFGRNLRFDEIKIRTHSIRILWSGVCF